MFRRASRKLEWSKLGLRPILIFLQRHGIDDSVFYNILTLYSTINRVNASGYTQKNKNTDFFKKINKYVYVSNKIFNNLMRL
jgi:hypothetical protein